MVKLNLDFQWHLVIGLIAVLTASLCGGFTDPRDVFAINTLHAALGSPSLPGWVPLGGDPCLEAWQGVMCVNSNITGISLNGANLAGELGTSLDSFTSIISIDLSGNHIGGTIPGNLPPTLRTLFLSSNQLTGSIPETLSALSQLTDMSLNDNHLTGEIPDSFEQLKSLINLDMSANNLSGPLPPSMSNLSSLTTLHLQNNGLTGTLNVLEDLPLINLDIENNKFSGPIPPKLLIIPNFRGTGNPFNTTVLPSPPAAAPTMPSNSSLPGEPSPKATPKQRANVTTSVPETGSSEKSTKYVATKRTIVSAVVVVFILAAVALGLWICVSKCWKRREVGGKATKANEKSSYEIKSGKFTESLPQTYKQTATDEAAAKLPNASKPDHKEKMSAKSAASGDRNKDDHAIDMTGMNITLPSSQPLPPPGHLTAQNTTFKPITLTKMTPMQQPTVPSSVNSFTIALLQQYTNSFSQENLIGEGTLGSVYRGELPGGKLVAVKKLNPAACRPQNEAEFVQLVNGISKIQHDNIIKLIGYCAEYGQRLLVYEHCNNGTLCDALHFDDDAHKNLSWNVRVRIALGAARALEYLHEVCQPAIVHKNFKSANILLDDNFAPRISDCGLSSLLSDAGTSQLESSGYGAPELELGSYTKQSDVFSFGVVMLELLTGRKSYDRSRPRGEQALVRWVIPQLHDIDALSKMVDPSLKGVYPSKLSLSRFADIISLCVQAEPEFRPPMSEIVENLLKMVQIEP